MSPLFLLKLKVNFVQLLTVIHLVDNFVTFLQHLSTFVTFTVTGTAIKAPLFPDTLVIVLHPSFLAFYEGNLYYLSKLLLT